MQHLGAPEIGDPIPPPSDFAGDDFEAIEAAVMETVRGRWFLNEFARRRRAEEASRIISAIERLESRTSQAAEAEARARAEADRASSVLRQIAAILGDWRPARTLAPPNIDPVGALESRLAALARFDALDVAAKFKLFD